MAGFFIESMCVTYRGFRYKWAKTYAKKLSY